MTFSGIKHRLDTSLIALGDDITPEQFTTLQITIDNLSDKLLSAVREIDSSNDEINNVILLAEKELIHEMLADENVEPLSELFKLGGNVELQAK